MNPETTPTPDTENQQPTSVSPVVAPKTVEPATPSLNYNVIGRRISAALLDIILWVVVLIFAAKHFGQVNSSNLNYNANLTGVPAIIFILSVLGYYILMELLAGGTLGKLAVGIRVRNEQDEKLTFAKSLVRNLLRIVDGFPYFIPNLVGLITLSTNDKKQRIGDKAAHTVVVKADESSQHTSLKSTLALLALIVAGIALIATIPASKSNVTQAATTTSTVTAINSNQAGQTGTAESIANQFVDDIASDNPTAAYQLTTAAYQAKTSLAQNASTFLSVSQLFSEKPVELSGQSANQGTYVFNVQTNKGQQSIIVSLQYANNDWLVNGWSMVQS